MKDASTNLFYIRGYAKKNKIDRDSRKSVRFASDTQLTIDVDIGDVNKLAIQLIIQLSNDKSNRREREGRIYNNKGNNILGDVFEWQREDQIATIM